MRKVNEVSKLFGITRRTLPFYDDKGLLINARTNAETILTGFFAQSYNLKDYEIRFTDK